MLLRFLKLTAEHQDVFKRISNHKNFIPTYLDNVLIDFAQTARFFFSKKKNTVPRNTAAIKIGHDVISLL